MTIRVRKEKSSQYNQVTRLRPNLDKRNFSVTGTSESVALCFMFRKLNRRKTAIKIRTKHSFNFHSMRSFIEIFFKLLRIIF